MRKQIILNFGIIAAFLLIGAVFSANAQTKSKMVADIPFDFYINNQKQAAGTYEVKRLYVGGNQTTLVFRKKDGKKSTIVRMLPLLANKVESKKQPCLIFNRYGASYYLTEVINPSESFGGQLPKTKGEIQLAKNPVKTEQETVMMKESGQ